MFEAVIVCVVSGAIVALAFNRITIKPHHYEWPGDERGEPFRDD